MRKLFRKLSVFAVSASMLTPSLVVPAAAAETEEEYKIYPTVQSIAYKNGETTVDDIHVVFGSGVDEFTKDHLQDVFKLVDASVSVGTEKVSDKTNVLVGTEGDNSLADLYFDSVSLTNENLFETAEAFAMEVNGSDIVIQGTDSDGAFYALTTLMHIFKQDDDGAIRNFILEDYPDIATRGFIEGYYGNPWSHEDRMDLMTFGGEYKMNAYIYAPKNDPKHNEKWRELYTEEELALQAELAEAGNRSKCYYVYALHPFMYNAISFANDAAYEADLTIIKTKFEQLMEAGVKKFCILADDAGVPSQGASTYVRLMTDLTNWMIEKQETVPGLKKELIFCPNDYMGSGSSSQMQTLKQLPDSVSIIQTGGRIWGEVSASFNNTFYNNMGRPAFMWINWPCSDNTKEGLIMGGAEAFLKPGVQLHTIDGIVLNPMQQSEPSKEALFTCADYAWNVWTETSKYDSVWEDSFAYMDHGTAEKTAGSDALMELSKHMKNSKQVGNSESEEISAMLASYKQDLASGRATKAQTQEVREEMEKLQQAAATYRAQTGNTRTLEQIIYWIDAWDDYTEAALEYLTVADKLADGASLADIWNHFSAAQKAKASYENHPLWYIDHYEYARVGRVHLTPFLNSIASSVSEQVMQMINPEIDEIHFITNRNDTPTGDLSNALDGSDSTEIIFKSPTTISVGEYVGASFTQKKPVTKVTFKLGQSGNANDTFAAAKAEITYDGKLWQNFDTNVHTLPQEVVLEGENLNGIKGVRMVATANKTNTWLGVKDIIIETEDTGAEEGPVEVPALGRSVALSSGMGWYQTYTASKVIDDDMSSLGWTNAAPAVGATLTVTFSRPIILDTIHFKQDAAGGDSLSSYTIQYSEDGTTFKDLNTYDGNSEVTLNVGNRNLTATAIRVLNNTATGKWWKIYDFNAAEKLNVTYVLTNTDLEVESSLSESAASMSSEEEITLQPGDYLTLDLQLIQALSSLSTDTYPAGIDVEISKNNVAWEEYAAGAKARYIRVSNSSDAAVTFTLGSVETTYHRDGKPVLLADQTTIGITTGNWASEDCRNNGAAFDGNYDNYTEFAQLPTKGEYLTYDLGVTQDIRKIAIYNNDSHKNYIRDGIIQISADLENWTDVVTIGDGVENTSDADVTALESDAGYKTSTTYPNKVYIDGELEEPVTARYLRITFTASNKNRAVLFNEIEINDGEPAPMDHPSVTSNVTTIAANSADNMQDLDLTTSWKTEDTKAGFMQFDFSDKVTRTTFNIVTAGDISNASIQLLVMNKGEEAKWVDAGTLSESLVTVSANADYVLSIRFDWEEGKAPEIAEIVRVSEKAAEPAADYSMVHVVLSYTKDVDGSMYAQEGWDSYVDQYFDSQMSYQEDLSDEEIAKEAKAINNAWMELRIIPTPDRVQELLGK